MFSFIKMLQAYISRLSKHRGLWFTTISIVSTSGILITMYFITTMTNDVAERTSLEQRRVDVGNLQAFYLNKYNYLVSISSIISNRPDVIKTLKQTDYKEKMSTLTNDIELSINDTVPASKITIDYYKKGENVDESENRDLVRTVLETNEQISGITVNHNGVVILGLTPVYDKDANATIGVIQVGTSIHSLKDDFVAINREFAFVVDKRQMVFMDLEHKSGNYQDVNEKYKIAYHNYDTSFYMKVGDLDFKELFEKKYMTNKFYYFTYDEVVDINGRVIGLAFIGQDAKDAKSFIAITKSMIDNITTIALGLVISLILFMF